VVGRVDALDAHARVLEGEALAVDRLVFRNHPRQRAETGGDAGARRVETVGEGLDEHRRIEFPGLTVDVEIGPWEMRLEQRADQMRRPREKLLDISIFGLPDRQVVEP